MSNINTREELEKIFMLISKEDFKRFLKGNINFFLLCIFIFSGYGIKLFYDGSGTIDTVIMVGNYETTLVHYATIGRFGFCITKFLTSFMPLNPFFQTTIAVYAIGMFALCWSYLIYVFSDRNKIVKKFWWLFASFFATGCIWAEQLYFIVQAFEVAWAVWLCGVGLLLFAKGYFLKNKKYIIVAFFCSLWSFATYQSILVLHIAGVSMIIFILCQSVNIGNLKGELNKFLIINILWFLVVLIGYEITNKVLYMYLESKELLTTPNYLSGSIRWLVSSPRECVYNILGFLKTIIFGDSVFYNKIYSFLCTIVGAILVIRWKKKEGGGGSSLCHIWD